MSLYKEADNVFAYFHLKENNQKSIFNHFYANKCNYLQFWKDPLLKIRFYGNVLSVTSNEADKTDAERVKPNINNENV
jgi:hypothetical protein